MRVRLLTLLILVWTALASAETRHPRKQLLAIGEQKGHRHEAVSHALAKIERLGHDSDLWDTTIRSEYRGAHQLLNR